MCTSQAVWVWNYESVYKLKNRIRNVKLLSQGCSELSLKVRIGTQVCSDSNLMLHQLGSLCAVICDGESHTGSLPVTVGRGACGHILLCLVTSVSLKDVPPSLLLQQKRRSSLFSVQRLVPCHFPFFLLCLHLLCLSLVLSYQLLSTWVSVCLIMRRVETLLPSPAPPPPFTQAS